MLLACEDNYRGQDNTWRLETDASNHICGRKSMFIELDESLNNNVSFGDDFKGPFKGRVKIFIYLKDRWHQFILNVYYVPNIKNNILSLGQFLEKGYDSHERMQSFYS